VVTWNSVQEKEARRSCVEPKSECWPNGLGGRSIRGEGRRSIGKTEPDRRESEAGLGRVRRVQSMPGVEILPGKLFQGVSG
jgi:hypothetical protein